MKHKKSSAQAAPAAASNGPIQPFMPGLRTNAIHPFPAEEPIPLISKGTRARGASSQEAQEEARVREALGALARAEALERQQALSSDVSLEDLVQGLGGGQRRLNSRTLADDLQSLDAKMAHSRPQERQRVGEDLEAALEVADELATERGVDKLIERVSKFDAQNQQSSTSNNAKNPGEKSTKEGSNPQSKKPEDTDLSSNLIDEADPDDDPISETEKEKNGKLSATQGETVEFKKEYREDLNNPKDILYYFPGANGPSNQTVSDEPIRPKFPTFPIDPSGGQL